MSKDLEFYTQSVRIRVDGKTFVGCLNIDALGELQKIWGIEGLDELQARVTKVGFAEMKDIVFVSLLRDQPKITRAESDKIANAMGMNGIVEYVSNVMKAGQAPGSAVAAGPIRPARSRRAR
jgi:hypothetical protein